MSHFNVSFNPRLTEIQKRISGYENYFCMILDRPASSFRFFSNLIDTKDDTEKLLAKKPERFWKDEAFKLRERWRKLCKKMPLK